MGNGDVAKFPHGSSGRGGLITPPSPRSLRAESGRPRQRRRRRRSGSNRARGRAGSKGGGGEGEIEPIDHMRRRARAVQLRHTVCRLEIDRTTLHYQVILTLVILRLIRTHFEKTRTRFA